MTWETQPDENGGRLLPLIPWVRACWIYALTESPSTVTEATAIRPQKLLARRPQVACLGQDPRPPLRVSAGTGIHRHMERQRCGAASVQSCAHSTALTGAGSPARSHPQTRKATLPAATGHRDCHHLPPPLLPQEQPLRYVHPAFGASEVTRGWLTELLNLHRNGRPARSGRVRVRRCESRGDGNPYQGGRRRSQGDLQWCVIALAHRPAVIAADSRHVPLRVRHHPLPVRLDQARRDGVLSVPGGSASVRRPN